ncbi:S41 family peptidase [Roseisolibacter agri]|uniref:Interphotoreceptor retinoid-binding protein n=1 Tax=Roseisolibacter agri TaxID=2014610 RepID=A0AA37QDU3_9BACT|nr:S41 family peptidase [Roseisolibacter agri]GLC24888.1 interphotoreceptor retinoid-binding protein [Roseisolibacter agri]
MPPSRRSRLPRTRLLAAALPLLLPAAPALHAQAPAPTPLTAAARRQALDSAAVLLSARYLDPAAGRRLADSLRAWARRDAFATVADPARLADTLGRALRTVVADKHLYLRHVPNVEYVGGAGAGRIVDARVAPAGGAGPVMVRRSGRVDPRDSATIARTNFGFAKVERLEGNVGYVKLDLLVPPDYARATADAALAFLRHTEAVILDVRDVPGGAPQMMQYLLSHFVTGPATLLHASFARADNVADSLWSVPALAERGLGGKPLYILTSARSASAAEMLAYVGQRSRVATVVGETTSGAGNGGRPHTIGAGLQLFVPERQILTGPGWEQTGVVPDVAVPAADALTRALALARQRVAPGTSAVR